MMQLSGGHMVQSSRQAEAGRAGHRGVWEAGQLLLAARGFPPGVEYAYTKKEKEKPPNEEMT